MRMDVRVPIRVWFSSIRVSDFWDLKCQPHSGYRCRLGFGLDLCVFGVGSDNPFKLF